MINQTNSTLYCYETLTDAFYSQWEVEREKLIQIEPIVPVAEPNEDSKLNDLISIKISPNVKNKN